MHADSDVEIFAGNALPRALPYECVIGIWRVVGECGLLGVLFMSMGG